MTSNKFHWAMWLSSELNLIFLKSFPYLPVLPFIFSMELHSVRFLIPSQSSIYFANTSLSLSVEAKTKYFFSILFFSVSIYFTNHKMQRIYTMNIFILTNIFDFDISNVININVFGWFFCLFFVSLNQN